MTELSIVEAAREAPERVAIESATQSMTFAECAVEVARNATGDDAEATARASRVDGVQLTERAPRAEHAEGTEDTPRAAHADPTEHAPRAAHADATEHAPRAAHAELTEHAPRAAHAEVTEHAPRAAHAELTEHAPRAAHGEEIVHRQPVENVAGRAQTPQIPPTGAPAQMSPSRSAVAIIATPSIETVLAVHTALATRRPIALLHHRLVPAEAERQRALVESAALPPDAAVILFTSGSTGAARGVVLSRGALAAAAAASAKHLGWRDNDRWLLALSLAHAGGVSIVIRCLAERRPIVLCDGDFDRERVARLLERCTLASLVPAQLASLLDDPAWRPPPRLRAVLLGGAAAPPALLERAAQRGVPFLTTYGMTETLGQVATAPAACAGDPRAPLVALDGVELSAGSELAPAPIVVRAPMLATSYLDGAPIAPAFATADLGYVAGGALQVTGRRDDVIITGGENVHPSAIEAVLAATPGVRDACVFGVRDERWGQVVAAALVVDDAFDLRTATDHWHAVLPPHARPRHLAICARLPLLPSGKIDRRSAATLPGSRVSYSH